MYLLDAAGQFGQIRRLGQGVGQRLLCQVPPGLLGVAPKTLAAAQLASAIWVLVCIPRGFFRHYKKSADRRDWWLFAGLQPDPVSRLTRGESAFLCRC
jgi:hypothetical protein